MINIVAVPASVSVQRRLCGQKEHHGLKCCITPDESDVMCVMFSRWSDYMNGVDLLGSCIKCSEIYFQPKPVSTYARVLANSLFLRNGIVSVKLIYWTSRNNKVGDQEAVSFYKEDTVTERFSIVIVCLHSFKNTLIWLESLTEISTSSSPLIIDISHVSWRGIKASAFLLIVDRFLLHHPCIYFLFRLRLSPSLWDLKVIVVCFMWRSSLLLSSIDILL